MRNLATFLFYPFLFLVFPGFALGQMFYASQFPGSDCGAKINAADLALGGTAGEIWVDQNCGLLISTQVTLSPNHMLRFIQGGTYMLSGVGFTLDDNTGIYGTPASQTEDPPPMLDNQTVILQVGSALPGAAVIVQGQNVVLRDFQLDGNNINATGVGTNTSVCTSHGSCGHLNIENFSSTRFTGDALDITSTGSTQQAIGAEVRHSAFSRSGNGIVVTLTPNVYIHDGNKIELNGTSGITLTGSQGTHLIDNDISNSPVCIYVQGYNLNNEQGGQDQIAYNSISCPSGLTGCGSLPGCGSDSVNAGILVQGYALPSGGNNRCGGGPGVVGGERIIGNMFSAPGSSSNFYNLDYIHLADSTSNLVMGNFTSSGAGSLPTLNNAVNSKPVNCTGMNNQIIGNTWNGAYNTPTINNVSVSSFAAESLLNTNGGKTDYSFAEGNNELGTLHPQDFIVNTKLINNLPLYCNNAAGSPIPCLKTDSVNNLVVSGDSTAGVIVFQPHQGGANVAALYNPASGSHNGLEMLAGSHIGSQSSNKDISGQCTLGTNCAITFTNAYIAAPVCVATDTSAIAAVKAIVTGTGPYTGVTFTGNGTDTLNYICMGNPN